MFTAAERSALLLTVTFLVLGAGIKAWIRARVELGPFPGSEASAAPQGGSPGGEAVLAEPGPSMVDSLQNERPGKGTAGLGGESAGSGKGAEGVGDTSPSVPVRAGGRGASKPSRKGPPSAKVDLNLASADRLAQVPGIGPKTAEAIVEYRRAKGGIRDVRELLEVKGIGEKKLELITPWVRPSAEGKPEPSARDGSSAGKGAMEATIEAAIGTTIGTTEEAVELEAVKP